MSKKKHKKNKNKYPVKQHFNNKNNMEKQEIEQNAKYRMQNAENQDVIEHIKNEDVVNEQFEDLKVEEVNQVEDEQIDENQVDEQVEEQISDEHLDNNQHEEQLENDDDDDDFDVEKFVNEQFAKGFDETLLDGNKFDKEQFDDEQFDDKEQPEEECESQSTENNETIEKLQIDLKNINDKHLRLMAEYDNYRKRTLKEKSDLMKTAGEKILTGILPLIDDFERALQHIDKAADVNAVKEGTILIYNKFVNFLLQHGIKEIDTIGKDFDPEIYEAITKIPAPNEEMKGKILDCVEKGYMLDDKVIRYPKVVVGE
jgi:molecular chaperone GrpE